MLSVKNKVKCIATGKKLVSLDVTYMHTIIVFTLLNLLDILVIDRGDSLNLDNGMTEFLYTTTYICSN